MGRARGSLTGGSQGGPSRGSPKCGQTRGPLSSVPEGCSSNWGPPREDAEGVSPKGIPQVGFPKGCLYMWVHKVGPIRGFSQGGKPRGSQKCSPKEGFPKGGPPKRFIEVSSPKQFHHGSSPTGPFSVIRKGFPRGAFMGSPKSDLQVGSLKLVPNSFYKWCSPTGFLQDGAPGRYPEGSPAWGSGLGGTQNGVPQKGAPKAVPQWRSANGGSACGFPKGVPQGDFEGVLQGVPSWGGPQNWR
jgi:hypothetical protein